MAPKKKSAPSTSAGPSSQPLVTLPIYFNDVTEKENTAIKPKEIVHECGMALVQPQVEYVKRMEWTQFVQAIQFPVSQSVVQDFYSNLFVIHSDQVPVLGQLIDISQTAIKAFYGLPDIVENRFSRIIKDSPSLPKISQVLTEANMCRADGLYLLALS